MKIAELRGIGAVDEEAVERDRQKSNLKENAGENLRYFHDDEMHLNVELSRKKSKVLVYKSIDNQRTKTIYSII